MCCLSGAGSEELPDAVDRWGDVLEEGERVGLEGHWCKGVAASVEHFLGKALTHDHGLGMEVEEHGVGFPTSNKFDGVGVNACTEEGCAPPPGRMERALMSFGGNSGDGHRHGPLLSGGRW